ncbi:hypothetical protein [Varibaculum vaginae]|uniref:hypothetical protein n=1 Tax=Varibaculum vaginae TaxID=2364797 RepID=UPI000F0982B0|nr:hypothetical protein [Varibaculum vaginae]
MTQADRPVPSDHELEALLADTRALLAEKARWEDDQVNRDLDLLLRRVRGVKRGSYAQALRSRAKNLQTKSPKNAVDEMNCLELPVSDPASARFAGVAATTPDQLAEQLARAEAEIDKELFRSAKESEVAEDGA